MLDVTEIKLTQDIFGLKIWEWFLKIVTHSQLMYLHHVEIKNVNYKVIPQFVLTTKNVYHPQFLIIL